MPLPKTRRPDAGEADSGGAAIARSPQEMSRRERAWLVFLLALSLCLRLVYLFHLRFDTDEPQHLHVAWSWTQGLLPYRDVFDNHMPLFHLLVAPLAAAIGERPEILFWVRAAMIPVYGLAFWATYDIGRTLYSSRVGLWAVVLTALLPRFFLSSVEFRADALWAALWLAALAILVRGRLTRARSFAVGAMLGAAVGVSLKTMLLLVALGCALLFGSRPAPSSRTTTAELAAAVLAGILLIPLGLVVFFATRGALAPFVYGTVEHNFLPGLGLWRQPWAIVFPAALAFSGAGARALVRSAPNAALGARRAGIFLAAFLYLAVLRSFWPLITAQDFLPFFPLLGIHVAALPELVGAWTGEPGTGRRGASAPVLGLIAMCELAWLFALSPPWRNRTAPKVALLDAVLRLTGPGDSVMDLKGETVFRRRPFFYALEGLTRERMARGLIAEDIPERLIATETCVVVHDSERFPPRTREFLLDNYLSVGPLRVAGRLIRSVDSEEPLSIPFTIETPARYALVAQAGSARGSLDGIPYEAARRLERGEHLFRALPHQGRIAVVWARAPEEGFFPCSVRKDC